MKLMRRTELALRRENISRTKRFWALSRLGNQRPLAATSFRAERGIPPAVSLVEKRNRGIPRAMARLGSPRTFFVSGVTALRVRHRMAMLRAIRILAMVLLREPRTGPGTGS